MGASTARRGGVTGVFVKFAGPVIRIGNPPKRRKRRKPVIGTRLGTVVSVLQSTAVRFQEFSAAAQLDNFCYAKIWTRTVLAESPENSRKLKHDLIVTARLSRLAPLYFEPRHLWNVPDRAKRVYTAAGALSSQARLTELDIKLLASVDNCYPRSAHTTPHPHPPPSQPTDTTPPG
jgi:hypothetical protein